MEALDLTTRPPRSPFVKIGGLLMLARTIDKLRAELPGGAIGEFHYASLSEMLCIELGISHDDILEVVTYAQNDDEVVAWVHANSDRSRYEAINEQLLARKITSENRERLTIKYPVIAQHPQLDSILEMLDLDDAAIFGKVIK